MNFEPAPCAASADAVLFQDCLSCQARLPVEFVPSLASPCPTQAESLLHALALVEDASVEDAADERGESSPLIQRIDAKLDVLLLLVGRLLQRSSESLSQRAMCWSARGVRLEHPDAGRFPIGSAGILRLQPSAKLPECLELPASVLASDTGGQVWLKFADVPSTLSDALERHLFRQHRRDIAQARRR